MKREMSYEIDTTGDDEEEGRGGTEERARQNDDDVKRWTKPEKRTLFFFLAALCSQTISAIQPRSLSSYVVILLKKPFSFENVSLLHACMHKKAFHDRRISLKKLDHEKHK